MQDLALADLTLFARVAALGTLAAVARERNVPTSQVSRAITRIEKTCGTRLLHRSTHGLSLTPEGETFLAYCERIGGAVEELEGEFAGRAREPAGLVRVAASTVVAEYVLVPGLAGLIERHPKLRIDLLVGDRVADMVRERIDIAIRTTPLPPEAMVAREIGVLGRALYASPEYARRFGLPQRPEELRRHRLVTNSAVPGLNVWVFVVDGRRTEFVAEGDLRTSDTGIAAKMVLQGLGIGRLSTAAVGGLVREGRLVPVLADCVEVQPLPIYAVTAGPRLRLPKIRACVDYWAEWIARR